MYRDAGFEVAERSQVLVVLDVLVNIGPLQDNELSKLRQNRVYFHVCTYQNENECHSYRNIMSILCRWT